MTDFTDVLYEVEGPTAVITINRAQRYNAFTGNTIEELVTAFMEKRIPDFSPYVR